MSLAALNRDWNPEPIGGDELAEMIERVAALEVHVSNIREGQDRLELKTDHLDIKLDFHAQETSKALQEIKEGIAVRNATTAERNRNLAVAGSVFGAAAMGIGTFIWANAKSVLAFLATVFR